MSACPFCAEEVEAAAERCPHCGEPLVRPAPAPGRAPLPGALRALAWLLLLVALLRLGGLAQTLLVYVQFGLFTSLTLLAGLGVTLGHMALLAAAGVGLLRARPWGAGLAWAAAGLTVVSLVPMTVALIGAGALGLPARALTLDYGSVCLLPASLLPALAVPVVLLRGDVQAALREGR